MRSIKYFIFIFLIFILGACSTTKNVPDGKYLLDEIKIKSDNKIETSPELEDYVRQQPNGSLPLIGKVGLKVHSLAGKDTTKWINRTIRKIGSEPVIYNPKQAAKSAEQIRIAMQNIGYLEAKVDTTQQFKKKKAIVTYNITTGIPYRIRNYANTVEDTTLNRITKRIASSISLLHEGDLYNQEMLENERVNINNILRNVGYYNFSKDFVYFKVDTTLNSHQADLYLNVYPAPDSLPHARYKINDVTVVSGFRVRDTIPAGQYFRHPDTTYISGMRIIKNKNRPFLRNSTLKRNNYLWKGMNYSDYLYSRTYENFNNLGAIQQTNIQIVPIKKDSANLLNVTIILSPANAHWFKASLEGTNSAGDIGIAPSVSYQHQNLFNGGEIFSVTLKGAYEFITGSKSTDLLNQNYYEYGTETSLTFPQFLFPWLKKRWREQTGASTKFSLGLNNQHRPEYTRQFFSGAVGYGWDTKGRIFHHNLDLINVNYVRMPWMSDKFKEMYIEPDSTGNYPNQLLRESYKDQLIAGTTYTISYFGRQRFRKSPRSTGARASIEVAGAFPRLITDINGAKRDDDGSKKLFGVSYAEYVKGTADFSQTLPVSRSHTVAYHIGIGFAYPYGNSNILPYERRFFAGGANSIRGWNTRSLGPGSYRKRNGVTNDFVNQTGDILFLTSIESRHKLGSMFELAGFVDAGNIWTVKDYEEQPNGHFKFSNFYKEIAVAYGLGIRFDLGFLLLRLDTGVRAYDPSREIGDRLVIHRPAWSRMAWHFGIGYPF
ncbi:BamA/TamA family outer membrane protein [Dysgonomonas sp. 25]|uniref:translocation and assembly module lipoprotein TamL n=1 Tax=Dysgonomonas sp. 25 TaxID=2302933 RepID=UPI0013D8B363|nr:BamA/TamA family outer membrane protein [Dysgonomonas sp. 25]NDV69498.1 hypothetical protein [Dysgonomonas sp. 25]